MSANFNIDINHSTDIDSQPNFYRNTNNENTTAVDTQPNCNQRTIIKSASDFDAHSTSNHKTDNDKLADTDTLSNDCTITTPDTKLTDNRNTVPDPIPSDNPLSPLDIKPTDRELNLISDDYDCDTDYELCFEDDDELCVVKPEPLDGSESLPDQAIMKIVKVQLEDIMAPTTSSHNVGSKSTQKPRQLSFDLSSNADIEAANTLSNDAMESEYQSNANKFTIDVEYRSLTSKPILEDSQCNRNTKVNIGCDAGLSTVKSEPIDCVGQTISPSKATAVAEPEAVCLPNPKGLDSAHKHSVVDSESSKSIPSATPVTSSETVSVRPKASTQASTVKAPSTSASAPSTLASAPSTLASAPSPLASAPSTLASAPSTLASAAYAEHVLPEISGYRANAVSITSSETASKAEAFYDPAQVSSIGLPSAIASAAHVQPVNPIHQALPTNHEDMRSSNGEIKSVESSVLANVANSNPPQPILQLPLPMKAVTTAPSTFAKLSNILPRPPPAVIIPLKTGKIDSDTPSYILPNEPTPAFSVNLTDPAAPVVPGTVVPSVSLVNQLVVGPSASKACAVNSAIADILAENEPAKSSGSKSRVAYRGKIVQPKGTIPLQPQRLAKLCDLINDKPDKPKPPPKGEFYADI